MAVCEIGRYSEKRGGFELLSSLNYLSGVNRGKPKMEILDQLVPRTVAEEASGMTTVV
jgi:hypothetical protein